MAGFKEAAPDVYNALAGMGREAVKAGFSKELIELVKIRASQINGCAYCLHFHLNLARAVPVDAAKLDLLSVWREVALYSPRERAALALTEALTDLAYKHPSDSVYDEARVHFDGNELIQLVAMIGTINMWNRIGVIFNCAPALPAKTETMRT